MFAPLRLRELIVPNRLVFLDGPTDEGAGLVVSEQHAVSPEGRASPETPLELTAPPERVCAQFVAMARRAAGLGHRMLLLDCARGGLLATTLDEVNTILAAGRADLCALDRF